jgi:predicted nucleic acid-binding protein
VARRNLTLQLDEETIRQAKIPARRAGATRLVTEDLQPGRQLAGVTIENPFA